MQIDIPEQFICPITYKLMKEPYIDIYGNTYEKDAIYKYLEIKQESPLNRQKLLKSDLILNRNLKDIIEDFLKKKIIIDEDDIEWINSNICKKKTYNYLNIDENDIYINNLLNKLKIKKDWDPEKDIPKEIKKDILYYKWKNIPLFRYKIYNEISNYFNPHKNYNELIKIDNYIINDVKNIIERVINKYDNLHDIIINTYDELDILYGIRNEWINNKNKIINNMKNRINKL